MSENVISISNVSKSFVLRHQASKRYVALRDVMAQKAKDLLSGKTNSQSKEEFWALKDVSFDVKQGDRVGIIGRNGAGKSTLLKVLSRIVTPTSGRIVIDGRVASLLEVGTGFHPELSGRENIFLNGAILGMGKNEIKAKFDEIVNFAEVEKFLDTPVKRYSSGMYVRLAFAVAAHLDSEILIVDEVLAVGDSEFQKKCLGKMEDISSGGRTVLFVSHNLETIQRLCTSAVLLERGTVKMIGKTQDVVRGYLNTGMASTSMRDWSEEGLKVGDDVVTLKKVWAHDEAFHPADLFDITRPVGISMQYEVKVPGEVFTHSFNFFNEDGLNIFNTHDTNSSIKDMPRERGIYTATMWIQGNLLAEGTVIVGAAVIKSDPFHIHFHEQHAISFTVIDHMRGDSARGKYTLGFAGAVRPLCQWNTIKNDPQ